MILYGYIVNDELQVIFFQYLIIAQGLLPFDLQANIFNIDSLCFACSGIFLITASFQYDWNIGFALLACCGASFVAFGAIVAAISYIAGSVCDFCTV